MDDLSLKPPRSPFPWMKLILMALALAVVIWLIYQLNTISTAPLIEATPDIEIESPVPESIDVELEDPIAPPANDDPPNNAAVTPPSLPADLPTPTGDMQRMLMERVRATVTYVYDGDTIMLADGTSVRFVGVDAPERDEPYFTEATALTKRLLEMKSVQTKVCKKRPRDDYGRTLAEVSVDGQSIDEALLNFGLAEVYHDPDCIRDCHAGWGMMMEAFRNKRGMFENANTEPVPAVLADRLLNQFGLVVGRVDNIRESSKAIHLNFGSDWTTDFSATINLRDLHAFLRDKIEPQKLVGQELTLFGKVVSSYGPRIFLVCPAQIINIRTP
ncbi:MAG: thermonuclease family protein [Alphaproteobacteria bacterium]